MKYLILFFTLLGTLNNADAQTVGLFQNTPNSFNGYTLFSSMFGKNTYLINNCGKLVHSWTSTLPSSRNSQHLLPDGNLMRSGNVGNQTFGSSASGGFEKLDWQSNVLWSYSISDTLQCAHHDFIVMPNGNILTAVWESKSAAELKAAGRNPATIGSMFWVDKIVELKPINADSAVVVWEWKAWDHLVQDYSSAENNFGDIVNHPELININLISTVNGSWLHMNSLDYDPIRDQILFSLRNLCEVMIIDHSTTTAEASGHSGGNSGKGGDILYRWGNPANYNRGTIAEKKLFQQHDAKWIRHGTHTDKISIFNNGSDRPVGQYSSIDIIEPPLLPDNSYAINIAQPYGPVAPVWTYPSPLNSSFYSATMGGAAVQPSGNLLICEGVKGKFFEIDTTGNIVWEYVSPLTSTAILTQGTSGNNGVFKINRYGPGFSAFSAQQLSPGLPIELNPLPYNCTVYVNSVNNMQHKAAGTFKVSPNPAINTITASITTNKLTNWILQIVDLSGRRVANVHKVAEKGINSIDMDLSGMARGCYIIHSAIGTVRSQQMLILN